MFRHQLQVFIQNSSSVLICLAGLPTTNFTVGHITDDCRSGTYYNVMPNCQIGNNSCTGTDKRAITDANRAAQGSSRRNMHPITNGAVVVNAGSSIYNDIPADSTVRIYNRPGHYHGSSSDCNSAPKLCKRVNGGNQIEPVINKPICYCNPCPVATNGNDSATDLVPSLKQFLLASRLHDNHKTPYPSVLGHHQPEIRCHTTLAAR